MSAAEKARARGPKVRGGYWPGVVPPLIVTILLILLHWWNTGPMSAAGNIVFDAYQRMAPREYKPDGPVRIVDIDDESIERLGQWPWPRTEIARLQDALADAGAAVIGYDVVFSEPDRTSPAAIAQTLRENPAAQGDYAEIEALADHDEILAAAFGRAPTVLGQFLTSQPGPPPDVRAGLAFAGNPPLQVVENYAGAVKPLPELLDAAAGSGFVSIVVEGDNVVRRASLLAAVGDQMVPALSLDTLRVFEDAGSIRIRSSDGSGEFFAQDDLTVSALRLGDRDIPVTEDGKMTVYYTAPTNARQISAWRILSGDISDAELADAVGGRVVLVGAGAQGLRDLISTPVQDSELGVVVHAQIIEQILSGDFLRQPDWWRAVEQLIVLISGLVLAFSLPLIRALIGGLVAAAGVAIVIGASWLAFINGGLLLNPVLLTFGIVGPYLVGTVVSYYREERRRSHIRNAFDRYLSPELVARIVRDPGQLELGGEERDMSVMFCDIRSFSRISEGLSPQDIISFLIEFLTPMTDILLERRATIDKYIGDAILAFWNAPVDDEDHARNAALGALDMIERLKVLNARNARDPDMVWPGEVKIGIGLNTGPCCVGNMGSQRRLNYSLIGDTVNLASRIEGLTKYYGVQIAVGQTLADRISDFALVEIDLVKVVGRDTPERLFALLGGPDLAQDPAFTAAKEAWRKVLAAYRGQDWDEADQALDAFEAGTDTLGFEKLASIYQRRISGCQANPPGPGWTGIFEATEK